MVVFAVKNLKGVLALVLLRGLTDLQPGHLLAAPDPHVLAGGDLRVSLKRNRSALLPSLPARIPEGAAGLVGALEFTEALLRSSITDPLNTLETQT